MAALLPRRRKSSSQPLATRRRGPASEVSGAGQAAWQDRLRRILAAPLDYRVCRGFKRLHVLSQEFDQPIMPDYARGVDERTLLPADQEADLFVRLNYCKFRADILRRQSAGDAAADEAEKVKRREIRGLTPPARLLEEIEDYLATATRLRDCLVRAFLKLAISLIGPFLSRRHGFEELLSEATMALLRAVEKFDPDRGFRFSTYATPAVRRQLERFVLKEFKDRQVLVRTAQLDTLAAPADGTPADDRQRQTAVGALAEMVGRLDAREQVILKARFGLEPGSQTESLQEVAGRLGVCRERVRQIESRAVERLRNMPEAATLR